jgi:hypothetical protein
MFIPSIEFLLHCYLEGIISYARYFHLKIIACHDGSGTWISDSTSDPKLISFSLLYPLSRPM